MKIEIRKQPTFGYWWWSCPACHYGMNIPWEQCDTWAEALAEVDHHIARHLVLGQESVWRYAL